MSKRIRRSPSVLGTAVLGSVLLLASACGDAATTVPATAVTAPQGSTPPISAATTLPSTATTAPLSGNSGANMDALIAAAKQEGQLTTIALPHDWCGYGDLIQGFKTKYGLQVNELNPDGGSGDEIEAIKANKDNKGPQAPDVIDVGLAFGPSAKAEGLLMPYKVAGWDTISNDVKDPDGAWYGDYYGVMALEINTDVVKNPPQEWADLLKPEYKGQVALAGDPRTSSQAINAVYVEALANGGSLDNAQPGLDFFAKLNQAGNFVPVIAKQATIAKGETPIVMRWDYNALADRDALKGNPPISVVVPPSAVLGGVYIQGISAYAPHPNAAKLWMEYLYSDEGQIGWLKGYCHPARYNDLTKRNVVPAEVTAKLPAAEVYAKAQFPTLAQYDKAKAVITTNWNAVVGADVK
ncbi:MAG TPA: extracellular solute-binding protein [Chloroflexia bacterium]|nr:extracellular solute-binding protein [Chloroflexia bacterium]